MKKSIYNIWVTKANGAFVYNSFNNVYVAVSLKLCKDFESLDLDAFAHMHPAAFQQFKEVGIINSSLKFEIMAKQLYVASQRVL